MFRLALALSTSEVDKFSGILAEHGRRREGEGDVVHGTARVGNREAVGRCARTCAIIHRHKLPGAALPPVPREGEEGGRGRGGARVLVEGDCLDLPQVGAEEAGRGREDGGGGHAAIAGGAGGSGGAGAPQLRGRGGRQEGGGV